MNKKYMVEALGTFILTFSLLASLLDVTRGLFPAPILAGLTLMMLVFMFGGVSGGHFNPAVSIGMWTVGKLATRDLPFYLVMQFAGAVLAKIIINYFGGVNPVDSMAGKPVMMMVAEATGAMLFTLGIAGVVFAKEKLSSSTGPFMVGLGLLLGLAVAGSLGSMAILNPAVAIGLSIVTWPYLLGSVVGSLIGFNLYKLLASGK